MILRTISFGDISQILIRVRIELHFHLHLGIKIIFVLISTRRGGLSYIHELSILFLAPPLRIGVLRAMSVVPRHSIGIVTQWLTWLA